MLPSTPSSVTSVKLKRIIPLQQAFPGHWILSGLHRCQAAEAGLKRRDQQTSWKAGVTGIILQNKE